GEGVGVGRMAAQPAHDAGPGVRVVEAGTARLAFVLEGALHDLFEGRRPAVPEQVGAVDGVDQRGRVHAVDAYAGVGAAGEALGRDVAVGAGQPGVGGGPAGVEEDL